MRVHVAMMASVSNLVCKRRKCSSNDLLHAATLGVAARRGSGHLQQDSPTAVDSMLVS